MLNKTNLARIDLNLLVLFEAVLEERHVGRAAARLHVSPSAVSHGLRRLRQLMEDPLFLRQPKGVVPTERATLLAAPIADILMRARDVLASANAFDPRKSARRFVIGAPDGASAVLLPPMLVEIRRTAPLIDLAVRNLVGRFETALAELDERTLDVAIVPLEEMPVRFVSRVLYDEDFIVVSSLKNPLGRKLSLQRYCELPHLVVSVSGDPYGMVDKLLEARGAKRRVALTVSNFMQALAIVEESDLVAALPRQFVAKHASRYKVATTEPPFKLLSAPIRAIVPRVATMDAGLCWLLDTIERVAKVATGRGKVRKRR
ncbi:MAG: LysR family transcriptional regulator [Povalibacter sp.]